MASTEEVHVRKTACGCGEKVYTAEAQAAIAAKTAEEVRRLGGEWLATMKASVPYCSNSM